MSAQPAVAGTPPASPPVGVYFSSGAGTGLPTVSRIPAGGGAPVALDAPNLALEPGQVAADAYGNVFYLTDGYAQGQLYEIPSGGTARPFAPTLTKVLAITVDPLGDLYASQQLSDLTYRVIEVSVGSNRIRVLGSSSAQGIFPAGIAVDDVGNVFVSLADALEDRVIELPVGGGPQLTLPTIPFSYPNGIAIDNAGNLYVDEAVEQDRLIKIPASGGPDQTLTSGLDFPQQVAVDNAGDAFIAEIGPVPRTGRIGELPAGHHTVLDLAEVDGLPSSVAVARLLPIGIADAGGDGQTMYANQLFAKPVVASVGSSAGRPLSGHRIRFDITGPASFPGGSRSALVTTTAAGVAVAPKLVGGSAPGPVLVLATDTTAGGTLTFTEKVRASGSARADLSLTLQEFPYVIATGQQVLNVSITVRNLGPDAAGPVGVLMLFPPGATANYNHGGTLHDGSWSANLPSLTTDPVETFDVTLVSRSSVPIANGLFTAVASTTLDPNPSNNFVGSAATATSLLLSIAAGLGG